MTTKEFPIKMIYALNKGEFLEGWHISTNLLLVQKIRAISLQPKRASGHSLDSLGFSFLQGLVLLIAFLLGTNRQPLRPGHCSITSL
jgi:hypothetical protein